MLGDGFPIIEFYGPVQICKTQQWPQDWKRSIFIPIPKKHNAKECSNYRTNAFISQAGKLMLKILHARFNSMWTKNFQMLKLELERAEEPEIKMSTSNGSWKKQENSRNTFTSASWTTLKSLTVLITTNCGKFFKSGNTRPSYLSSEKPIRRSRRNN